MGCSASHDETRYASALRNPGVVYNCKHEGLHALPGCKLGLAYVDGKPSQALNPEAHTPNPP